MWFQRLVRRAKSSILGESPLQVELPENTAAVETSPTLSSGESDNAFNPDRPQNRQSEDRLGFRNVAQQLAQSIVTQSPPDGYVISIEGLWGCGKTSLLNFLVEELAHSKEPLKVVRFEPWIVGDKNGMLSELINDLAAACDEVDTSQAGQKRRTVKAATGVGTLFKSYGSKLGRATAPVAQVLATFGVPLASLVGPALQSVADAADAIDLSKPIAQMKQELVSALSKLNRRIVVIVDDLDRLEPAEAVEVLRLIRAVADFPNVIYVLSYDSKILAENVQNALKIRDGAAFLKKMVQVSFKVPRPEAFDLRRWFQDECAALYVAVSRDADLSDIQERLSEVCNIEGGLLRTPRDIVRALNAIKLCWPPVASQVDFPDMVWLQLRRMDSQQLYDWIEEYLVEYMALVDGATINAADRATMTDALLEHVNTDIAASTNSVWRFGQIVPGIKLDFNDDTKKLLFDTEDEQARANATNKRRLGSPQHYRYYFAMAKPSGALDDQMLLSFTSKVQADEEVLASFRVLVAQKRPQGGTMMSALIDRLLHLDDDVIPDPVAASILRTLSSCMDEVASQEGKGGWGKYWSWSSARLLTKKLLKGLAEQDRREIVKAMFASGEAIGWLMCELLRSETYSHGRYGARPRSEDEWVFTDSELDDAIQEMLARLRSDERRRIVTTPEVLSFMYGWKQLGDERGVASWVAEEVATDDGLLRLLYACRGWHSSSNKGVYYPLLRRDVEQFTDWDAAIGRVQAIRSNPNAPEARRALAIEVLNAVALGEDD